MVVVVIIALIIFVQCCLCGETKEKKSHTNAGRSTREEDKQRNGRVAPAPLLPLAGAGPTGGGAKEFPDPELQNSMEEESPSGFNVPAAITESTGSKLGQQGQSGQAAAVKPVGDDQGEDPGCGMNLLEMMGFDDDAKMVAVAANSNLTPQQKGALLHGLKQQQQQQQGVGSSVSRSYNAASGGPVRHGPSGALRQGTSAIAGGARVVKQEPSLMADLMQWMGPETTQSVKELVALEEKVSKEFIEAAHSMLDDL